MNLFIKSKNNNLKKFIRCIALLLCFTLVTEQSGFAQATSAADVSKHFSALSNIVEHISFRPTHLRALSYNHESNDFKILMDKGSAPVAEDNLSLENTTRELFDYFLIGITLPNESFWVNLRPDAALDIIDPFLARTDMGRVLLEADLQLKRDTAGFVNPATKIGKEYWEKLYKKAEELFGFENVTIPTITRPWIIPGEIVLSQTRENAYIYKASLKVMLEADYLKDGPVANSKDQRFNILNEYAAELSRSLILPKLTYEVNTAKRYAPLRQVYYSLILAQWFKQRFYGKGGYYSWLINKRELSGLTSQKAWSVDAYFEAYRMSFKNGEFNLREKVYSPYGQSIRNYVSGGIIFGSLLSSNANTQVKLIQNTQSQEQEFLPEYAVLAKVNTRDMQRQIKIANSATSQEIQLTQYAQKHGEEIAQDFVSSAMGSEISQTSPGLAPDPNDNSPVWLNQFDDLSLRIEEKSRQAGNLKNIIHGLRIEKASLREGLHNFRKAIAVSGEKSYQSSSPILLPILVISGISIGAGYLLASHKMNKIKALMAKKDAQIDLLSEQVKSLTSEVRSLRKEMSQFSFSGQRRSAETPLDGGYGQIVAGSEADRQRDPGVSSVENDLQSNPESAPWMSSFKAAYAQWLYLNPKATTKEKVSRVFSLCGKELLKSIGGALDLDSVDTQFIKGLIDFVAHTAYGKDGSRPASDEELAIIRLEVESKIERLLADKELLARKIRKVTQDFSLRGALETTVLEGNPDARGNLGSFLDDKSLEYQNTLIGFTVNKLEIAWSEYKQLDNDGYLRLLYEKAADYNDVLVKIENAVYARIVEEIPALKDAPVAQRSSLSFLRSKVAMIALLTTLIANTFTTSLSAAAPLPGSQNNPPIVEMVLPETGIAADADTARINMQLQARDAKLAAQDTLPQVLIPVDRQVAPDTLKNKKLAEYYEIVKIGEVQNTSKIRYLRRVLRQYDDSKPEALNPGAILKYVSPISGSSKPGLNAELTIGGVFDFLKSGVVHLLALGNESEPSNRVAAAWALGKMRPAVESSSAKRAIIEDLSDALNKDKDPYVRAAAAWALSQYNDSRDILIGTGRDVRIESLTAAINDEEWLVRYYVALALATSEDSRAIQPILNLLDHETNPYVISAASDAALKLNSLGAVLPVIKTLEKLQFYTSEDEVLYSLDSKVAAKITLGLTALAKGSAQLRQQVIMNFITALQHIQARQDMSNKYDIINYSYLPAFKHLVSELGIKRSEITPNLKGLDPRICQALFNIIEPISGGLIAPLPALKDVKAQYLGVVEEIAKNNPRVAEEIADLLNSGDSDSLNRILLFDRTSSARRILAADALYKIGNNVSMRALVVALGDSHPTVKAAAARALRNIIASRQFVYTGKDGSIVKALADAVNSEDWIVVVYLIDTLRSIGDADALQAISAALASSKHQFISLVVSQALAYFSEEGSALIQPLLRIFAAESSYDIYTQALTVAKGVLAKTDDPLLIDGIINLVIMTPVNPQDYSRYALMKEGAIKALSQSQGSLKRLLSLFQEKKERNDYAAANQILSLLQGLVGPDALKGFMLGGNREISVEVDSLQYVDLSGYASVIFDENGNPGARMEAIDKMAGGLSGSGNIAATEQLLILIDSESNADIAGHAIAAAVKINSNGLGVISQNGQNPLVKAFTKIADSNKSYEIRKLAIEALGKSGSDEALEPLTGILQTSSDPSLIMVTLDAATGVFSENADNSIIDALASVFIDKLDFSHYALEVNPGITKAQNQILNILSSRKEYSIRLLNRLLRDELSRSFKEQNPDRVDNIRYLMALVNPRKAVNSVLPEKAREDIRSSQLADIKNTRQVQEGILHQTAIQIPAIKDSSLERVESVSMVEKPALRSAEITPVNTVSLTNPVTQFGIARSVSLKKTVKEEKTRKSVPQIVQEEIQLWVSEAPASQPRVQALLRLAGSGDNLYVNPFELRAIREDIKDADEDVRIAASFVYSKINHQFIYHIPNTNVDVELLSKGLNSTGINFRERLFKIIALGKSADPLAARLLLQAYYKIQEAYPVIEGQTSGKEHEKLLLAKAIEWSLENMQKAAVDELGLTLTTRFNQGKLDYYDIVPISILERLAPEEFNKLIAIMRLKPVTQSPDLLIEKYTQDGNFYQLSDNMEKKALVFQWDSYNQVFNDKKWQEFGLSSDFDTVATALVSHSHTDHQLPIAAAVQLGEMKDVRAVWALNAGLQDDDEFVVAASARALSRFESPVNEQDVRIPFLKQTLEKHTHPSIRANVALALGTSGDPRAVELLNKLLSPEENALVKIFAINSAKTLASKFKNSTLVHGILTLARQDYNYDPLAIIGQGENFGPVGSAAFDAVNAIGGQPELKPVLVKTLRDALVEELKQETKNIRLINDVYSGLLKEFGPQDYAKISDVMMMVKLQYWFPVLAAALGGILAIGGIFLFIYSKIFRGKPKLLADIDSDRIVAIAGGEPPEPQERGSGSINNQIGQQLSFSAEHEPPPPSSSNIAPKFKAIVKEWESSLIHDQLSEADISRILQSSYILINLIPFSLAQNGNDLEARASQIDTIINLLQNTLDKLINAMNSGHYLQNKKIGIYAQECIEICRYFSDYQLALGYLEDLHLSANYKPTRESKAIWRKIWGIEAIAIAAKENLAYLLEKIYTRGNRIVPYFYQVPKNNEGYKFLIKDYYEKLKPSKLGIARLWQIRKEMTRLMPLYFGIGFGAFTAIAGFSALIGSFTMGHVLWYFFRVFTSSFMGVGISTYFSWQFIKRGWEEESETFKKLHARLDGYEKILREYSFPGQADSARGAMLDEEINEITAALSAELGMNQGASADAILVMTGTDPGRGGLIKNNLKGLIKPNIPVFAVTNDIDLRGKALYGSGASFVKACSYFDSFSTFGNFIDGLFQDRNSVCLNKAELALSPEQLQKPVKKSRVIIINADTLHLDWLTAPLPGNKLDYRGSPLNSLQVALANGYRITQMLKKQNRSGVAHFNADGVYIGPVEEFKDDLTIFASWSSQEQMARQGLGLLMPDSQSHIIKYYDKFKIGKISNWLEREMVGGRYDLGNTRKRQMVISTGILVASFEDERRFAEYLGLLKKIRDYLLANGTPGNLPVKTFLDIFIPLIMLSQGENIYTYLEARLRNLAEEYEFAAEHKEGLRMFYIEMYKIIEENFPTDRPFIFPAQVPYPHESVYSRGSTADLAAVLGQYGFSGASSPVAAEFKQLITAQKPAAAGGIDFRNLKVMSKNNLKEAPLSDTVNRELPDEEWQEINRLIKARITPSLNRIVDYLESGAQEMAAKKRINNVRAGIADILRMEEETVFSSGSDFKGLLELIENSVNSSGLKQALSRLT